MTKLINYIYLLIMLMCFVPQNVVAQSTDETVVEFTSSNAKMEDNPNAHNYNITIFSPDGKWKMQLNYDSDSMFGTFGNDAFRLSGEGKYYNYVRNPKNDMVFYSFVDMNVTVADEGYCYKVNANCLTNNKMRFIVEATIDAPKPKETRTDDLGFARIEQNSFYGSWNVYAENDNYKLAYGVASNDFIGTFYRADMLLPELTDKTTGRTITILNGTAWHTKSGDKTNMKVELLSDEHVLYSLTMFNESSYQIDIKEEKNIDIHGMVLQDLTDMYGCYQFGGVNNEYGLAVAVESSAFTSGRTKWTRDDLIMQFTRLVTLPDQTPIDIFDVTAELMKVDGLYILKADVTSMTGVLYHVMMHMDDNNAMPEPKETVNVDFGHVAMLDYTKGLGLIGVGAVKSGECQMRFYLNAHELEGSFQTQDFNLELCDMMVVDNSTFKFYDGKYVNASMEKKGNRIFITADMYCVNDVLYHATMYVDDMTCLHDNEYKIDRDDNVSLLAIQQGTDGNYSEYELQFQNLDKVFDNNEMIVGDGYCFSFYFGHNGAGVSGEYGYSAGTLAEDEYHTFYEHGCEVRVAPVAGTLTLKPTQAVTATLSLGSVNTYIYECEFQFVGQNSVIYKASGNNVLICLDEEGKLVNIDEPTSNVISQALSEQGYQVRKVMADGKIIIAKQNKQFDLQGKELR